MATIYSDATDKESSKETRIGWILAIVTIVGLAARWWTATLGTNYDMKSWFIAVDIMRHGGCVYAETGRYNYGPVWFFILYGLDILAAQREEVLRYLVTTLLSFVDLGIFLVLLRRAGLLAATLFFLNPISILITGYHGQFDNLAILLGLLSVEWMGDDFQNPVGRKKLFGLLLLGLSLMTKHLFFAFPFWLAVKQEGLLQKAIIIAVPGICFLLGFAPYWPGHSEQILQHVFQYGASCTGYFYKFFVPQGIQYFFDDELVWYGLLALFAFICRNRTAFDSLLIYVGVLVAFSPATSNQYLAIPVVLAACYCNSLFILYTVVSLFHICTDPKNGLGLFPSVAGHYDNFAIYILCFALVYLLWKPRLVRLGQAIKSELYLQWGQKRW